MNDIEKCNKWYDYLFKNVPFSGQYDFKDKSNATLYLILYMLNRTQSMFEYDGLPDTIPARSLELYLQMNGNCCITDVRGTLYALTGGLGGEPDPYYMPTIYTVANPALSYSKNLKINEECIIINNDSMYLGLMPLFSRYATLMAENDISIRTAIINSRIVDLITADDDQTKESAELFIKRIINGDLSVISSSAFLEGLKTLPYGSVGHTNSMSQLIEMQQYLKAGWYNDIGLNANYNMKREALSTAESQLNDDALLPLVDDMLKCRKLALEKVNEKYGLDVRVSLASSWEDNQQELDAKQDQLENDPDPAEKEENNAEIE